MGFDIANNSLQESAFIVTVVATAISISAVVLRFVAVRLSSRKPRWEDLFAVLACLFLIAYVVPFLYSELAVGKPPLRDPSRD
jgi:hypothetical protein